jgi:hypothetical protein
MKNYNTFLNKKIMYHVTDKKNIDSILNKGLLINQDYYMTEGGSWATEVYGCNPIFLSKYPDKTNTQELLLAGDIIFEVDVTDLDLIADLPSLIDNGAYIGPDVDCLYWMEGEEPEELIDFLDQDGQLYFEDLLNPDPMLIGEVINLTGSAAYNKNIDKKRIKLYEKI